MKVISNRRASKEVYEGVLKRIVYNGDIGNQVKKGKLNTVLLMEDEYVSGIGFTRDRKCPIPIPVSNLVDYIQSLFEYGAKISSLTISEKDSGYIDVDIKLAGCSDVVFFCFKYKMGGVRYIESVFDSNQRFDEPPYPSYEWDEPDEVEFCRLLKNVLNFCGNQIKPIRRLFVFSMSGDIRGCAKKKCYLGMGGTSNYYGLESYEDSYNFPTDDYEYNLYILIEE